MKDYTPTYIVKVSYISFISKSRKVDSFHWKQEYGRPTKANLAKWRKGMNDSLQPGKPNHHLRKDQSDFGTCWIENQKKGNREVARFTPPTFEVV